MTDVTVPAEHAEFLSLVPVLERFARFRLHHQNPTDCDEGVADVIAHGFASFLRLKQRAKAPTTFPSTSRMGETVSDAATLRPSSARRTVSTRSSSGMFVGVTMVGPRSGSSPSRVLADPGRSKGKLPGLRGGL